MPDATSAPVSAPNPYVKKVSDAFIAINNAYSASLVTTNGIFQKADTALGADHENKDQVLDRLQKYAQLLNSQMQLLSGLTLTASLDGKNAIAVAGIAQVDAKNTNASITAAAKNVEAAAQSALKFHADVTALYQKLKMEDPDSSLTDKLCLPLSVQTQVSASTAETSRGIVLDTAIAAALHTADSVANAVKTASTMLDNLSKGVTTTAAGFQASLQTTFGDYNNAITKVATDAATFEKIQVDKLSYNDVLNIDFVHNNPSQDPDEAPAKDTSKNTAPKK